MWKVFPDFPPQKTSKKPLRTYTHPRTIILRNPTTAGEDCRLNKFSNRASHDNVSEMLGKRRWFVNDTKKKNRNIYYQIIIWLWDDDLDRIADLDGNVIERRKVGCRSRFRIQVWLHERELPQSKIETFKARMDRLQSLRSFSRLIG